MSKVATQPTQTTNETTSGASEAELQSKAKAKAEAEAKARAAKQAEQEAIEEAEYNAILDAHNAFLAKCKATGKNVLARLAREVGQSVVSKNGRPAPGPYARFTSTLLEQVTDFSEQDRMFRLAQKSVELKSEEDTKTAKAKFVTSKSGAAIGKASCTLRMLAPANIAIALGE